MPKRKNDLGIYPVIKVVGVGGAGGNALTRMAGKIRQVELVSINTDLQDLRETRARRKVQIGKTVTRGLGSGMNPEIGRQAAEENRDEIAKALEGGELIFLTCGLGGGTGSGAAPVVAEVGKSLGALVVAVVTRPFEFEGEIRRQIAEEAWQNLAGIVDAIITIPNDRIFALISHTTPLNEAFWQIDEVLRSGVQGISDLIVRPGLVNVDFADIKAILSSAGPSLLGIGFASGEERAKQAAEFAIKSPLLDLMIDGARGVLFSVSGRNMAMAEVHEAAKIITESIDPKAKVIFGATFDPRVKKKDLKVTVIATGFGSFVPKDASAHLAQNQVNPVKVVVKENPWEGEAQAPSLEESLKPYEKFEEPAFLRKRKKS